MILKLIISVLVIIGPAVLCYSIAETENRNSKRWFIYGLIFNIYAVIYLVFYAKEGDGDKIKPTVMFLLVVLLILMAFGLYQTFYGGLLR